MANEFVVQNGLLSLDTSTISGSLTVTGGITGSFAGTGSVAVSSSWAPTKTQFTITGSTGTLTTGASASLAITGSRVYSLLRLSTSAAAWVRVYTDPTSQITDAGRSIGIDPTAGSGVVAEVITTGAQTQSISPFVVGGNLEQPNKNIIYLTVNNQSGTTTSINLSLTILPIES